MGPSAGWVGWLAMLALLTTAIDLTGQPCEHSECNNCRHMWTGQVHRMETGVWCNLLQHLRHRQTTYTLECAGSTTALAPLYPEHPYD